MVGERHIGWEGITSLRLDLDKPLVRVDWMELGKGTIHIGEMVYRSSNYRLASQLYMCFTRGPSLVIRGGTLLIIYINICEGEFNKKNSSMQQLKSS